MVENLRETGIDVIGDVPWGTHLCQFYQTRNDLLDILIPYFKAGLKNNEYCMWITSEPLNEKEALRTMERSVPGFEKYLNKGQIEVIPHTDWYLKGGTFDSDRVLNGWTGKLNLALANGYDGIRVTGNTAWLEKKDWNDFVDYEEGVYNTFCKHRVMVLCSYFVLQCDAAEIIDIVQNHHFVLVKRMNKWSSVRNSEPKYQRHPEKPYEHLSVTIPHDLNNWLYEFSLKIKRAGGYRIPKTVIVRALIRALGESNLKIDLSNIRVKQKNMHKLRLASSKEVEDELVGRLIRAFCAESHR